WRRASPGERRRPGCPTPAALLAGASPPRRGLCTSPRCGCSSRRWPRSWPPRCWSFRAPPDADGNRPQPSEAGRGAEALTRCGIIVRMESLTLFSAAARRWFSDALGEPTEVQARGWPEIAAGRHALLCAPTGSGKTLAAFLWFVDSLGRCPLPAEAGRCRGLYISPLKALTRDVEA